MKITVEKEKEKISLEFNDDIGYDIMGKFRTMLFWLGFTIKQINEMIPEEE